MYWTSVAGGGRHQTRQVVRRAVRRAPPPTLRPTVMVRPKTRSPATSCLVGFLWLLLIVMTLGIALIPLAISRAKRESKRKQMPDFLARQLVARAISTPDQASALGLLHAALDTDPDGKDTLLACANWFYDHQCWADAADAYAGYLHLESNIYYETRYSKSLIGAGNLDEAIAELQHLLTKPLDESGHDFMLSQIALAFMLKGEASQGLAFANQVGLGKHTLSPGAQTALMMRASARYLVGQKAKGIEDLERLYAMGPSPAVLTVKSQMQNGEFKLEPMKPFPDWYPHTVEVREGPPVEEIPDHNPDALGVGAISPDGSWRWTGVEWIDINDWVPIDQTAMSHAPATPAEPAGAVDAGTIATDVVNGNEIPADHPDASNGATVSQDASADQPVVIDLPTNSPEAATEQVIPANQADSVGVSKISADVPLQETAAAQADANVGLISPDGAWRWTGLEWVAATNGDPKPST